jgi:thiamine pyrophosphokinase
LAFLQQLVGLAGEEAGVAGAEAPTPDPTDPTLGPPAQCALIVSGSPEGAAPTPTPLAVPSTPFAPGASAPSPLSSFLAQLASLADFIVAVDSGADLLQRAGLTPSLLLGDFDSVEPSTLASYCAKGVECARFDAYKDATDIELAFAELLSRNFAAAIVANAFGGRLDHELAALGCCAEAARQGIAVTAVREREACVFLCAEGPRPRTTLRLDCTQGPTPTLISLIPWGGEARASISGVEWPLSRALLTPGSSRGVSNVLRDARVDIHVHTGTLIIVLEE